MSDQSKNEWSTLSAEEKKKQLYLSQKELLEQFLAHGAIDQRQFDKSLQALTEKMGMGNRK